MDLLGERPVWSMSGGEMLSTLDTVDGVLAWLETYRLQLVGGLDNVGYAEEIGAHDTARLLQARYRMNGADARRDVRFARALPKYHAVANALAEHAAADPDVDYGTVNRDEAEVASRSTPSRLVAAPTAPASRVADSPSTPAPARSPSRRTVQLTPAPGWTPY